MAKRHDAHELKDLGTTITTAVNTPHPETLKGEPTTRSKHLDEEHVREQDNQALQNLGYKPQLNVRTISPV